MTCPRLIEVALPIREISAESVRDKSLRHGHLSTLHQWWARRPLPASRAVVFGSIVPDPDDPACPAEFREAVLRLLKTSVPVPLRQYGEGRKAKDDPDPYRPYEDISDTPRNRLLAFIAKWSPEWIAFERGENDKQPKGGDVLDARSLVKWETTDPNNEQGRAVLMIARELVRLANGSQPTVLDSFAGGGSIPLEAIRLGCKAVAHDYNPVAYLILRATCQFPQRFGKQGLRAVEGHLPGTTQVENVLVHDVEYWAKRILERARDNIGDLYPPGKDGKGVVGYFWARTAPCSNPACRAEIPLLRSLLICNKKNKKVALTLDTDGNQIAFGIAKDEGIEKTEGTMLNRGDCRCPLPNCKQITTVKDLRRAGEGGKIGNRMVAVIIDTAHGKDYRPVEPTDIAAFEGAKKRAEKEEVPNEPILPEITANLDTKVSNSTGIRIHQYGMKTWGSTFNPRQLLAMQTFTSYLHDALTELSTRGLQEDYRYALATYLGIWVSRNAMRMTMIGRWDVGGEKFQTPFELPAIPMKWDYPEANPFSNVTGGFANQLKRILSFISHESSPLSPSTEGCHVLLGDGARLPLESASAAVVVTDPPYFDEIAYADMSDFFYVWLKRALGDFISDAFVTPLTPKADEATALKHRHGGDPKKSEEHFTKKLAACLAEARRVCNSNGLVAVMFAHQSTEAWTALIDSLFEAGLNVTATYPIDTELKNRTRGIDSAALESSITVTCRQRKVGPAVYFRDVVREIEGVVTESVHRFWAYGFRGADLIVACYGPAVSVFGRYERVERGDGRLVEVPELLDLAKAAALKAIAGEFHGDALSRVYFVWANLYGITEQSWDDARIVVQIGGDSEDAMEVARRRGLFVVDGATCRLAVLSDRAERRHMGDDSSSPLIDQLHHAMQLWKEEDRTKLVSYLRENDLSDHPAFWKLAQALFEVLPRNEEDWKIISALLGERETLRMESRRLTTARAGAEALPFT